MRRIPLLSVAGLLSFFTICSCALAQSTDPKKQNTDPPSTKLTPQVLRIEKEGDSAIVVLRIPVSLLKDLLSANLIPLPSRTSSDSLHLGWITATQEFENLKKRRVQVVLIAAREGGNNYRVNFRSSPGGTNTPAIDTFSVPSGEIDEIALDLKNVGDRGESLTSVRIASRTFLFSREELAVLRRNLTAAQDWATGKTTVAQLAESPSAPTNSDSPNPDLPTATIAGGNARVLPLGVVGVTRDLGKGQKEEVLLVLTGIRKTEKGRNVTCVEARSFRLGKTGGSLDQSDVFWISETDLEGLISEWAFAIDNNDGPKFIRINDRQFIIPVSSLIAFRESLIHGKTWSETLITLTEPLSPTTRTKVLPPVNTSGEVHVRGYYRKDGTYVRPHTRSRPGSGRKKP